MDENEHIFFSDLKFPGQYYGVLIRSPVRHGKLISIVPPELPDGYFLYTAKDVPGKNYLELNGSVVPVFTPDEINYLGEPLGILVGPDYEITEDLAEKVEIQAETLEAVDFQSVFEKKTKDSIPPYIIHSESKGDCEKFLRIKKAGRKKKADPQGEAAENSQNPENKTEAETVEKKYKTVGKSKNELIVVESCVDISPQDHFYAETPGAVVRQKKDCLEIYTATQWPFHVRKTVSLVLNYPSDKIIVAPTEIGEALDGKIWMPSLVTAQTALASFLCKKPVKVVLSRNEDFLYTLKSSPAKIEYRTAVSTEGKIKAMETNVWLNIGGYSPFLSEIIARTSITASGLYNIENQKINITAVRTNLPPMGAMNGFGEASVFFALESHMALVAEKLNMLPTEIKKINAAEEKMLAVVDKVCESSAFLRKYTAYENLNKKRNNINDGSLRGIGLTWGYQGNGFVTTTIDEAQYSVEMTMETNGEIHIKSGFYSPSMKEILSTIAAETLDVEKKLISFTGSDTTDMSSTGPDTLSSKVAILAPLVSKCCSSIQRQRFRKPLPITVKKTYKPVKNPLEKSADQNEKMSYITTARSPFISSTPGACAVELEMDPLNYDIKIRGIWISCAAGRLFNRHAAVNTVKKTVKEAVSKIISENINIEDGKFQAKDGILFDILSSSYIPEPEITFIESKDIPSGLGTIAYNLLPGAYGAALAQITGRVTSKTPVDAEYVYNCLEEKEEAK